MVATTVGTGGCPKRAAGVLSFALPDTCPSFPPDGVPCPNKSAADFVGGASITLTGGTAGLLIGIGPGPGTGLGGGNVFVLGMGIGEGAALTGAGEGALTGIGEGALVDGGGLLPNKLDADAI